MDERVKELAAAAMRLTPDERAALAEALWDALVAQPDDVDMPDWHKAELDERLSKSEQSGDLGRSWDEIKRDLKRRYKE